MPVRGVLPPWLIGEKRNSRSWTLVLEKPVNSMEAFHVPP
jgi:hypothetical protein